MVFVLKASTGEIARCFRCSLIHPPTLKRALATSLVVGSILTALNQGDIVFVGDWSSALYWKIPLTYLTPFLVATWAAVANAHR